MAKAYNYFESRSGFTLLELVVVIVIVGVLASISLPRYATFIERARTTEALNGIAAIKRGELLYKAETGSFIYCGNTAIITNTLGVNLSNANWYFYASPINATQNIAITAQRGVSPPYSGMTMVYGLYGNGAGYWWGTGWSTHPFTPKGPVDPQQPPPD